MLSQNKNFFLAAAAALAVWLILYFVFVRSNWADADAKREAADTANAEWEKNFAPGKGLMPRTEAEKLLEENKRVLSDNLFKLQRIELGTAQSLHGFTVAAAGAKDPNNYFDEVRIKIAENANKAPPNDFVPPALGFGGDKASEYPVPVKLMFLAVADAFIGACQRAGVKKITRPPRYVSPRLIEGDEVNPAATAEDAGAPPPPPAKKAAPGKGQPAILTGASRIVQFPMKVTVQAEEKALNRLLWELQQPTGSTNRYLCLRGFQVTVKDKERGDLVDVTVAVSGLLNENLVQEVGIKMEGDRDDLKGRRRPPQW